MKRLSGPLRGAGVGIVLLVLVCMPFFKGLFFWTELLPAIALVALAFALWIVGRRLGGLSVGVPGGVAGGALLALAGCYALQFAWAVYPRGNLDWLLRVVAGWFVFVMFRAEASERLRRVIAWLLVLGAAGVALHGLAEFSGASVLDLDLSRRLSEIGFDGRMITTLEYPNTAAIFFLSGLFLVLGLGVERGDAWLKGVAGGLGTLLTIAFFFTVSRGAVVVVPFGLLILLLGLGRERVWPALLLLGSTLLPALAVAGPIGSAVAAKASVQAFTWMGIAVLVGVLIGTVTSLLTRLSVRRQLAIGGILVILGAGGWGIARAGQSLLPAQAARLFDISLKTQNVVLRLIYDKDAARMVADRPLGRGGWGWARSYRQYATFNYTARETHNHFAQTAVDAGVPGLLALVTAMGAALWSAWRNRKGDPLGWAMAAGAALIAGHSLIDFNLSYGGVWLMLWSLFGVAVNRAPKGKREGVLSATALASALAILVTATSLWQGARLNEEATQLAADGRQAESEAVAAKAVAWDRLSSEAMVQAADHALLVRAVQVDPTSPEAWFRLAISHELRKEWQAGLAASQKASEFEPWKAQYVDKQVRIAGFLMLDELIAGRRESAVEIAESLISIEKGWEERLASANRDQHLWPVRSEKLDPGSYLRFGQARFLTGDLDGAQTALLGASKIGLLNSEAEVWLYVLYERRGERTNQKALENRPWIRFRESNPVYKAIWG